MDNKKLIAGFGYQEGRISSWDGKRTYTQAAPVIMGLTRYWSMTGL